MNTVFISGFDQLKQRGIIEQASNEDAIQKALSSQAVRMYVGFDPTADSLHVGNLLPIMALAHLQRAGHTPIIVIGGATAMIGDPSGRSTERPLLTPEQVAVNANSIRQQMERFLSFEGSNPAIMVDNSEWTKPFSYLDWLRGIGKHFTINYMLAKESVRRRLEDTDQGISYTEFSYMLLQANDFLYLYDHYDCLIQGGGNDQWGNITAGIELIRKLHGIEAYGITFPLITTANGEKFGKSSGNAVWLDPEKTSPYQFYQFWIRTDDRDVERYLKLFTFLPLREIKEICEAHKRSPEQREAQKSLTTELTRLVHGEEGLQKASKASAVLFGGNIIGLSDQELRDIFADVPSTNVDKQLLSEQLLVIDLLQYTGLCGSRSEGHRLLQNGGIYLNNQRIKNPETSITAKNLASETMMVLRLGKKGYHLVCFA